MKYPFRHTPEPPLDPPEDNRKVVFKCAIDGCDIMEGDDYFRIEGFGPCCEDCIRDSKRYDAELPCYGPDRREED